MARIKRVIRATKKAIKEEIEEVKEIFALPCPAGAVIQVDHKKAQDYSGKIVKPWLHERQPRRSRNAQRRRRPPQPIAHGDQQDPRIVIIAARKP